MRDPALGEALHRALRLHRPGAPGAPGALPPHPGNRVDRGTGQALEAKAKRPVKPGACLVFFRV